MSSETVTPQARVRHALAALELAGIQHQREVRRRLRVGEEELVALLHLAHHGRGTQARLTRVTALSRSGAGAMVQRLEERGYVQRSTALHDRRLRLVELSPAGREALAAAYSGLHAAATASLDGRTPRELEAVAELLLTLAGAATAATERGGEEQVAAAEGGPPIWRRWS